MTTATRKPFTQLLEEVKLLSDVAKAQDTRAALSRYAFNPPVDGNRAELLMLPSDEAAEKPTPIPMTEHAYRQLLKRLDYPRQLTARLPINAVYMDVNWLMQRDAVTAKGNERLAMLRTVAEAEGGRVVRAVLGSHYNPCDDLEVLTYAAPWLEDAEIVYESINDTSTVISLFWPTRLGNSGSDLGIAPAMQIINSEVGTRSVKLVSAVFREKCGNILPGYYNGASDADEVGDDGIRRIRYQGKGYVVHSSEMNETRSHRMTHQGNPERLESFVLDAMEDLSTSYEAAVLRWREGLEKRINDPAEAIMAVAGAASLREDQYLAALNAWAETRPDFGNNVTGIANAFTLGAQSFNDESKARTQMERAGALAFNLSSN
jgi:hypothetical protein